MINTLGTYLRQQGSLRLGCNLLCPGSIRLVPGDQGFQPLLEVMAGPPP